MLGCKYIHHAFYIRNTERELIDTCWDVNTLRAREGLSKEKELIDTCWDVNLFNRWQ